MRTTRDQRRKQATYVATNRERVRLEHLRQAVSAELRRAAKESLSITAPNVAVGNGITATLVPTNLMCGGRFLSLYAYRVVKGGRTLHTMYVLEQPDPAMEYRSFLSRQRGAIARYFVEDGVIVRVRK